MVSPESAQHTRQPHGAPRDTQSVNWEDLLHPRRKAPEPQPPDKQVPPSTAPPRPAHLANELHVAVLDAVVHHLDEVARAAAANVHDARPVVHLAGGRGQQVAGRRAAGGWVQKE